MKVRPSVSRFVRKCKIIKRNGKVMVICVNPSISRHKGNDHMDERLQVAIT